MKTNILLIIMLFLSLENVLAQVGVNVDDVSPAAVLEIDSQVGTGRGGVMLPKLTTVQRDALSLTAVNNGMLIFNTDTRAVQMYSFSFDTWSNLYELETGTPPVASGVSIFGSVIVGGSLVGTYTFSDVNSDQESGTTIAFYSYDDDLGTNEMLEATGSSSFAVTSAVDGKFIRYGVTPRDDSNINFEGSIVYSPYSLQVVNNRFEFDQQSQNIAENASPDDIDLTFTYQNSSPNPTTVTVEASNYSRLDEAGPVNVVIPASTASPYTTTVFNVTNDAISNGDETVTFTISSITGGTGTNITGDDFTDTASITDDEFASIFLDENFETDGNTLNAGTRYTTSITEFISGTGDSDYFSRTDGTNISETLTGSSGSFFAANDIDGGGGAALQNLSFPSFLAAGETDFDFSIDIAEGDDASNEDWDAADYMRVQYNADGAGWVTFFAVEGTGSAGNQAPSIDTNLDGEGNGTVITNTFQTFTDSFTVPGATTNVEIRILFNLNAGDEDIAIDNIKVE